MWSTLLVSSYGDRRLARAGETLTDRPREMRKKDRCTEERENGSRRVVI